MGFQDFLGFCAKAFRTPVEVQPERRPFVSVQSIRRANVMMQINHDPRYAHLRAAFTEVTEAERILGKHRITTEQIQAASKVAFSSLRR